MYRYDAFDRDFVHARARQFRDQLERHLAGQLPDDEFRALRLQNGWYVQRHAPMLRVAVPYGELSAKQLRALARVARQFDGRADGPYPGRGGYGHFTTRTNCQYNWIALADAADVMDVLADADLHGIQTSGNCIRNITTDCFAGIAPDEVVDPRPYCEILRQWSTLHPEFAFLPRKFKIAVSGTLEDRAATAWHDIGLVLKKNDAGEAVAGDVADAVAAGLDAVHVGIGEDVHHVGGVGQGDPVVLAVLPRREVAVAAPLVLVGAALAGVELASDAAEGAQLLGAQLAVRDGHAQHRRMALDVPAVLQAQGPEVVVGKLPGEVALQLVAELGGALVNELAVEFCVAVHAWGGLLGGSRAPSGQNARSALTPKDPLLRRSTGL